MFREVLVSLAMLVVTAGCSETATPHQPDVDGGLCMDRRGGALITFCDAVAPGTPQCTSSEPRHLMTVWITNAAYIDEAKYNLTADYPRSSVWFLRDGADCDENHTWHTNPATVRFQDTVPEGCTGVFEAVDNNKDYWFHAYTEGDSPEGMFCPMAVVDRVIDLR